MYQQVVSGRARRGVLATGFLYKLCGSSQPSILKGADGAFYVVKFHGFPGSQGLANEVVGNELIRALGLPRPEWALIEVTDEFLDSNPGLWFQNEGVSIRPHAGVHFGSRLIEAEGEQRTYQMIPHAWINRIENRADFLGILAVDLWANNCDRRQAVFLSQDQSLHAYFIDNDFMFGGKFGNDITCPRRAMVHDLAVYEGLWNEDSMQQWLRKFDEFNENAIRRILASVPEEWADSNTRLKIFHQLRARRPMMPRLLNEAVSALGSGYSIKYHRSRNATEPGQIFRSPFLPLQQRNSGSACSRLKRRKAFAGMGVPRLEAATRRGRPELFIRSDG